MRCKSLKIISYFIIFALLVFIIFTSNVNALEFKKGNFTKITTVATQSITGVGFQPKVVIFFWTRQTAEGFAVHQQTGIGFANSSVGERGVAFACDDNSAASNCGRYRNATTMINMLSIGTPTVSATAGLTSFDSDGFTINWVTNEARADIIHYIALGGDDVANTAVGTFSLTATTGNQAVTGVGFQPDFVMFLWTFTEADATATIHGHIGIGFADSSTNQGSILIKARDGRAANDGYDRWQRTNRVILSEVAGTAAPTIDSETSFVSMDSGGFTVNKINAPAVAFNVFYLALKGGKYAIGNFSQATVAGNQQVANVGFQPVGLFLTSFGEAASTGILSGTNISIGAAHNTTGRGGIWSATRDAIDPSDANMYTNTTEIIRFATGPTPTTSASADFVGFGGDGFTLNWITTDAIARQILYIAFTESFPPNVTSNTNNVFVKNGSTVTLNATITDIGVGVKNATVNVSQVNSTINDAMLIRQGSTDFFVNTSIIADKPTTGFVNLTITAYDNASNRNNTINMTVWSDATIPNVASNTNNVIVKNGTAINLSATITDTGSGVQNATVNVSAINTTLLNPISLVNQSSGNFWNVTIIVDRATSGFVNLPITSYDNVSNVDNSINMTVWSDATSPDVTSNTNNIIVLNNSLLTLNATISDLGSGVKNATVNVSAINSTINEAILNNVSGFWINNSIIADKVTSGFVNLTITAYDNVGNFNNSINMTVQVNTPIDTSFTVSLPIGETQAWFNSSSKTQTNVAARNQTASAGFLNIINTGNVDENFYFNITSALPSGVTLKAGTNNNSAGATAITTTSTIIVSGLTPSSSHYVWLWTDFVNASPMDAQRILQFNSSQ